MIKQKDQRQQKHMQLINLKLVSLMTLSSSKTPLLSVD